MSDIAKKIIGVVSLSSIPLFTIKMAGFLSSLVKDSAESKLSFNVTNFFSMNIYTVVSFIIICFIILSFFSPSGYELRKNYKHADVVCYLPFDTAKNAENKMAKPRRIASSGGNTFSIVSIILCQSA